jgi:hypothetical protein
MHPTCPECGGNGVPTGEFAFAELPIETGPATGPPPQYQVHVCEDCGATIPPPLAN